MLNKMRIILDENNLKISNLNKISSGYYVQIDDFYFPSKQWIDLSASIIEMWLAVMNTHLLCMQTDSVLHFMDGDYEIHLHRKTNYSSLAFFVEPDGNVSHSSTVDSLYLARQILSICTRIIKLLPESTDSYRIKKFEELSSALCSTVHRLSETKNNLH